MEESPEVLRLLNVIVTLYGVEALAKGLDKVAVSEVADAHKVNELMRAKMWQIVHANTQNILLAFKLIHKEYDKL